MIDFQFLRDCIKALETVQTTSFSMSCLFRTPRHTGTDCGTPACVIGHYVVYKNLAAPNFDDQNRAGHRILWLNECVLGVRAREVREKIVHGLTYEQRDELFGEFGCGEAQTKGAAIAYIQDFILRHGGSLEDPKPLDVCLVPNWQQISQVTKEDTCPLT